MMRFNRKGDAKKLAEKTQFTIKTKGKDDLEIELSGTAQGVIYKLSLAVLRLLHEGVLDDKDIRAFTEALNKTSKEYMQMKEFMVDEPKMSCKIAELQGEDAKKMFEMVQKVQNGELDPEELTKIIDNLKEN